MEYWRYGRIHIGDYCGSWIAIVAFLAFSAASLILKLPFLYVIFPALLAIIRLYAILEPNRERFSIHDNMITIRKGKKKKELAIPAKAILIVSYADICPLFAVRTTVANNTHILKDKYAISIVQGISPEIVLECLHRSYTHTYTTSTIEACIDEYNYVYSFVFDHSLLYQVINGREHCLIVPESLVEKVSIDHCSANTYIDYGY